MFFNDFEDYISTYKKTHKENYRVMRYRSAKNFIDGSLIDTVDADNFDSSVSGSAKFDLIISTISWGNHYPIQTYLKQVDRVLSKRGVLILDVRNGTGGIELLETKFAVTCIARDSRCTTVCCQRL